MLPGRQVGREQIEVMAEAMAYDDATSPSGKNVEAPVTPQNSLLDNF